MMAFMTSNSASDGYPFGLQDNDITNTNLELLLFLVALFICRLIIPNFFEFVLPHSCASTVNGPEPSPS